MKYKMPYRPDEPSPKWQMALYLLGFYLIPTTFALGLTWLALYHPLGWILAAPFDILYIGWLIARANYD